MDFVANRETQIKEMLNTLGIKEIDQLYSEIDRTLILPRPTTDDGLSEFEVVKLMEEIAAQNTFSSYDSYLGGGAYEHHVPAIVGAILAKSEFMTGYTPYQAEVSQGILQATFEFQTAICAITGMDVANASVYDGASACAEACLMALRHHKNKSNIALSPNLNPNYRRVVEHYLNCPLVDEVDDKTAAVVVQTPNYFGEIEQLPKTDAIKIVVSNPIAYGLFPSAAELGADIAVGDTQPFGIPLQFGGPYCGYLACKQELLRQIPGRIVGMTNDVEGKQGYVLTLQAREQHIRRAKATSNICTSQVLCAIGSLIAMVWYGPQGVAQLARTNYQRANYLKQQLAQLPNTKIVTQGTTFNEFVVKFDRPMVDHFLAAQIIPGIETDRGLLVAVTETKSEEQLNRYIEVARG